MICIGLLDMELLHQIQFSQKILHSGSSEMAGISGRWNRSIWACSHDSICRWCKNHEAHTYENNANST